AHRDGLATTSYTPEHPKAGRAPVPDRSQRPLHQQPGGAGWADDEIASEDLRRISLRGWREGFRRHSLGSLDRPQAGLEYARDLDGRTGAPDGKHSGSLTALPTWAVTNFLIRLKLKV